MKPYLTFKGGTSLSKVYGLIDRFSEDIDLSIKREFFGFGEPHNPKNAPSKKKQNAIIDNLFKSLLQLCINGNVSEHSRNFCCRAKQPMGGRFFLIQKIMMPNHGYLNIQVTARQGIFVHL